MMSNASNYNLSKVRHSFIIINIVIVVVTDETGSMRIILKTPNISGISMTGQHSRS